MPVGVHCVSVTWATEAGAVELLWCVVWLQSTGWLVRVDWRCNVFQRYHSTAAVQADCLWACKGARFIGNTHTYSCLYSYRPFQFLLFICLYTMVEVKWLSITDSKLLSKNASKHYITVNVDILGSCAVLWSCWFRICISVCGGGRDNREGTNMYVDSHADTPLSVF